MSFVVGSSYCLSYLRNEMLITLSLIKVHVQIYMKALIIIFKKVKEKTSYIKESEFWDQQKPKMRKNNYLTKYNSHLRIAFGKQFLKTIVAKWTQLLSVSFHPPYVFVEHLFYKWLVVWLYSFSEACQQCWKWWNPLTWSCQWRNFPKKKNRFQL